MTNGNQKQIIGNPEMLIPLDEFSFELSVRARNAIYQIKYFGQLLCYEELDFFRMPNVGRVTIREISDMITYKGYKLGQAAEFKADIEPTLEMKPTDAKAALANILKIDVSQLVEPTFAKEEDKGTYLTIPTHLKIRIGNSGVLTQAFLKSVTETPEVQQAIKDAEAKLTEQYRAVLKAQLQQALDL